ncbi:MAG: tetratricopeptide repeat protein [Candidatus Accumulibacter phosphatis]|uniref:tetratricopeptide repeat protein n=1 Tax=Candidatus Accumulibacter phosphatis TaxID=327160 RepID=UPI001A568E63|nr:tetratricopeptide repeat protein [Candidatus Accumulibacter phosphatis]
MNSPVAKQPTLAAASSSAPAAVFGEDLDGRHSGDFLRLQRLLEHAGGFQLVFAGCLSFAYRQALIDRIDVRHPSAVIVDLVPLAGPSAVLDELRRIGPQHNPIHLVGVEAWLRQAGPEALHALNYRRESLAADVPNTLVLWLDPGTIATVASEAPDLWAWRAAVLDFSHPPAERLAVHRGSIFLGSAERAQRERRLAEIGDYLRSIGEPGGPDAGLMLEASDIEQSLGRSEAALAHAKAAGAAFREIDDRRSAAVAVGRIADILASRGQLDEALALHEQRLPVAERLGDIDSLAHIRYSMAALRLQRGEHDSGGVQRIHDDLVAAFAISRQLGRPDFIGGIGQLLAQVLAMGGAREEARDVLTLAEAALARLDDAAGLAQVRALRETIGAS